MLGAAADCCCWLLLLVAAAGCCCWLLLLVAAVDCCCWLLLLVAVAGRCCWLLLLVAVADCCCWLLLLVADCWPESLWIFSEFWWFAAKTILQAKNQTPKLWWEGRWKRVSPGGCRVVDGSKGMNIMAVHWVFILEWLRVGREPIGSFGDKLGASRLAL